MIKACVFGAVSLVLSSWRLRCRVSGFGSLGAGVEGLGFRIEGLDFCLGFRCLVVASGSACFVGRTMPGRLEVLGLPRLLHASGALHPSR